MKTETCRDVLVEMLATASNISDFDDLLDFHGFSTDRIRAAIAADDAELARLRRLLEAARGLVNRGYDLQTVTRLQSAVQAIDQAEADHAS